MFGRLGSVYFLHLAEADARRRRLSLASRPQDANLGVFLRLLGIIGLGLAAASLISMILA